MECGENGEIGPLVLCRVVVETKPGFAFVTTPFWLMVDLLALPMRHTRNL